MFIGKKDEKGNVYYTLKDIPKIHKISTFFRYGFYVSLIVWMCGMCFAMLSEVAVGIKVAVIMITFSVYVFFVIGKGIIETKFGR